MLRIIRFLDIIEGGFAQKVEFNNLLACEAGESIKPGALAPGERDVTNQARETGESRRFFKLFARFAGCARNRSLRWGLRPRLYALACFAG